MVTSATSSAIQQAYTSPLQQKVNNQTRNPDPRPEDSAREPQVSGANATENANSVSSEPAGETQQFTVSTDGAGLEEQQTQQERGSLLNITV